MAQAGPGRRLRGAEIALVVVVMVLVLTFLALLVQRVLPADGDGPGQVTSATPTEDGTVEDGTPAPDREEDDAGENLSALDYSFVTPSGNIGCAMSPDRVVCGIAEFNYSVPGYLADSCTGNAGHFLAVTADRAALLCDTSGTTPTIDVGDAQTLQYGDSLQVRSFRCSSEETGVTCTHEQSGRSISVARAGYSLG